jgi:MinD superfamily P-loop ATPase
LELVTGRLDVGEVKTPAVVRQAREQACGARADLVLLDAPPGVACAAVASVRGADALVLVTEPTPFGVHDLALAHQLGADLGIPMGIVVNRDGPDSGAVESLSRKWSVPIVTRMAFDRSIAETYARGGNAALEVEAVRGALLGVLDWLNGTFAHTRVGRQEVER